MYSRIVRFIIVWFMLHVGAPRGTGEDGHISADFWHQSGTRKALPGEPQCRPVTEWTAGLLPQGMVWASLWFAISYWHYRHLWLVHQAALARCIWVSRMQAERHDVQLHARPSSTVPDGFSPTSLWHLISLLEISCRSYSVFGLPNACVCVSVRSHILKVLRTQYLTNCSWEFRQIYNFGTV